MRSSNGSVRHSNDWRDWVAFLGYVLATAVAVSVALASVVLLLSTQADDPSSGFADSPSQRPLPPAATMLQRGPIPTAASKPAATADASTAKGATPVVLGTKDTAMDKATKVPLAPVPGASLPVPATGSSSTGLPDPAEANQGLAAILQPIPEPSPTAASILKPGLSSRDTAGSVVEANATIDARIGLPAGASITGG